MSQFDKIKEGLKKVMECIDKRFDENNFDDEEPPPPQYYYCNCGQHLYDWLECYWVQCEPYGKPIIRELKHSGAFSATAPKCCEGIEGIPNKEDDECCDPYQKGSWRGIDWYCVRCGGKLQQVAKDNKDWGKSCWDAMKKNGSLSYQCSNEKCFHHSAPLILHHPIYGIAKPAGDSYSISWVK